jgi:hypothetical protein
VLRHGRCCQMRRTWPDCPDRGCLGRRKRQPAEAFSIPVCHPSVATDLAADRVTKAPIAPRGKKTTGATAAAAVICACITSSASAPSVQPAWCRPLRKKHVHRVQSNLRAPRSPPPSVGRALNPSTEVIATDAPSRVRAPHLRAQPARCNG